MTQVMLRLPGETQLQSIKRRGTYEKWRDKFTQWIIDEGRTHSWIGAKTGYSRAAVQLIAHALEIYTRVPAQPTPTATIRPQSYSTQLRAEQAERRHERELQEISDLRGGRAPRQRNRVALPPKWELPRTVLQWRQQEAMYAALRLEYGGQAREPGWWGTW